MPTVTVLGGGIAGCSTGHLLADQGYDVTIVEKDAIGGLLRDIEFEDEKYCDSAPHLLFFEDNESAVEDLFSQYSSLQSLEPYAKSYPRGDLSDSHNYPVTRSNASRWPDTDKIHKELETTTDNPTGETFDEFVKEQVGETLYQRYFRDYTAKHWGVDPSQITGDWFDYKINFPESEVPFFGESNVAYPVKKYRNILLEMIADCTVEFDEANGLISEGSQVCGIKTTSGKQYESDVYVSTIDPSLIVDTDESLNYRSMVILGVHADLDVTNVFPEQVYWGYFPNHYHFTRVTEYSFTDQSFDEHEFVFTFEFPCFTSDDLWSHDIEWFKEYITMFFADQDIDIKPHDVVARRAPRAYPLPVAKEVAKFESINGHLDQYDNLYNLGRVSTYQYIWIKDIVSQAYEVVDQITAATQLSD